MVFLMGTRNMNYRSELYVIYTTQKYPLCKQGTGPVIVVTVQKDNILENMFITKLCMRSTRHRLFVFRI
jgi:hypothetical protein